MEIIGIGTDIVSKERMINSKVGKRFLTSLEYAIYQELEGQEKDDFLSGRWAGKESIIKASNKKYIFSDISIINGISGNPEVYINGNIDLNIKLSISHEKDYTIAFSIILRV